MENSEEKRIEILKKLSETEDKLLISKIWSYINGYPTKKNKS